MERMTSRWTMRIRIGSIRAIDQIVWETGRGLRSFSRRYGLFGWTLLACAVVSTLTVFFVYQQRVELHTLQARLKLQTASTPLVPAARRTPVTNVSNSINGRDHLKAFEDYLLPAEDIPLVIQDLLKLAEDEGLRIQKGEYRPQIDPAGGFLRYRMNLPVKGSAAAIYRFMQAALLQQKTLALESIQFKREKIELSDIEARIQWVVLTRLPRPDKPLLSSFSLNTGAEQ